MGNDLEVFLDNLDLGTLLVVPCTTDYQETSTFIKVSDRGWGQLCYKSRVVAFSSAALADAVEDHERRGHIWTVL